MAAKPLPLGNAGPQDFERRPASRQASICVYLSFVQCDTVRKYLRACWPGPKVGRSLAVDASSGLRRLRVRNGPVAPKSWYGRLAMYQQLQGVAVEEGGLQVDRPDVG